MLPPPVRQKQQNLRVLSHPPSIGRTALGAPFPLRQVRQASCRSKNRLKSRSQSSSFTWTPLLERTSFFRRFSKKVEGSTGVGGRARGGGGGVSNRGQYGYASSKQTIKGYRHVQTGSVPGTSLSSRREEGRGGGAQPIKQQQHQATPSILFHPLPPSSPRPPPKT